MSKYLLSSQPIDYYNNSSHICYYRCSLNCDWVCLMSSSKRGPILKWNMGIEIVNIYMYTLPLSRHFVLHVKHSQHTILVKSSWDGLL